MHHVDLSMGFLAALAIAFFGSFSHCIGMCSPFVIIYSKMIQNFSFKKQILIHFIYNASRIASYLMLTTISFYLSLAITINLNIKFYFDLFIAVSMFLVGLYFAKFFNIFKFFNLSLFSPYSYMEKILKSKSDNIFKFSLFGFLNGFVPCGFIYFFILYALTSDSLFQSIVIVSVFGIITSISMISFAVFINNPLTNRYKFIFQILSSYGIISYSIYLFVKTILF